MTQLGILVIGIAVLFVKRVQVTRTTELRRPKTIIFGVATIVLVLISMAVNTIIDESVKLNIVAQFFYWLSIVGPVIIAHILYETKNYTEEELADTKRKTKKFYIILITILALLALTIAGIFLYDYFDSKNILTGNYHSGKNVLTNY